MVPSENSLAASPPELSTRVAEQAAQDAELTAAFLKAVGLTPPSGKVRRLPSEFLLELGAAMRLLAWEVDGLEFPRAGWPSARDAILQGFRDAAHRLGDPSSAVPSLCRDVFHLSVEQLAWAGPRDLQAEILLDLPDEDALVEAMAQFLWDQRAAAAVGNGSTGT